MTACVKNHSRRVALAVSASLVGALSLGAATVPAFAEEVSTQAEASDAFTGGDFTWNAEADSFGTYHVQLGEPFMLNDIKDAFDNPISMSDVTVAYFKDGGNTSVTGSKDGKFGTGDTLDSSKPSTAGTYFAVVANKNFSLDGINGYQDFTNKVSALNGTYKVFTFEVEAASLEGSFAYQGENKSDTTFQYTGFDYNDNNGNDDVHFADAKGNELVAGQNVNITIKDSKGATTSVVNAGTYTATITAIPGKGYSGDTTVTFKVRPIDLENDDITIDPIQSDVNALRGTNLIDTASGVAIYVNGDKVANNILSCKLTGAVNQAGQDVTSSFVNGWWAKVTFGVTAANSTDDVNFLDPGASTTASTAFVGNVLEADTEVNYLYEGRKISTADGLTIDTSKGESFDPSKVSAYSNVDSKAVPVKVTVYKDGEAVTDYSQPGVYTVRAVLELPADLTYAGSATFEVTVISKHFTAQPQVYVAVDGKSAKEHVEYDGKAVPLQVVAKDGSTVLTEGEDYTVTYTDKDGNAIEEIVEPGTYTGTVDFGQSYYWSANGEDAVQVDPVTFTVTVDKAQARSAKADQDLYSYSEDAPVAPTFTVYNKDDLSGLSLAVDPAETGVTYHKVKEDAKGNALYSWQFSKEEGFFYGPVLESADLGASDLDEEGWYVADITVPADDAHFTGEVTSEPFQVSSYAVFEDVSADAYYAQDVYNAAKLGYMTGVKGTKLFMPDANISRGELAKVFSNMAGRPDQELYTPTKFSDVDAFAWYAEPIAWASEAGIVTGYEGTDQFGPNDTANREQVAAMIYRYAKAQGKDMTVDDADAALAAYADGDQVSGWAKTYMAWCVENGVFGVNTDELKPQDAILRSAVASIAVRVQPEALK